MGASTPQPPTPRPHARALSRALPALLPGLLLQPPPLPPPAAEQVDSFSRLRSLLADAYADVSGEHLDLASVQIEMEQLDAAGFVPIHSSKALRRGLLQQARSLRASALVDAAGPPKNSKAAGGGRFRV